MNLLARSARPEFSSTGLGSRPPGIGGLDEPCGAIGRALSCDRAPGRASRGGGWKVVSRGGSGAEASGSSGSGWEVVCRGGSGAEATGAGDGWGVASRGGSGAEAFGIGGDRSPPSIVAAPNALPPGAAISPSSAAKTWSNCENLIMPLSLRMGGRPGSVRALGDRDRPGADPPVALPPSTEGRRRAALTAAAEAIIGKNSCELWEN